VSGADPFRRAAAPVGSLRGRVMILRLYLIAYAILVAAAVEVLWSAGVLARLPGVWVAAVTVAALALAPIIWFISRKHHDA
jgi:hypothetical protein